MFGDAVVVLKVRRMSDPRAVLVPVPGLVLLLFRGTDLMTTTGFLLPCALPVRVACGAGVVVVVVFVAGEPAVVASSPSRSTTSTPAPAPTSASASASAFNPNFSPTTSGLCSTAIFFNSFTSPALAFPANTLVAFCHSSIPSRPLLTSS